MGFIKNILKKIVIIPTIIDNTKRYSEMNRTEKREYKRYLVKNQIWDGEVVIENMDRSDKLHYRD